MELKEGQNRKLTLQRLKAEVHRKLLEVLNLNEARRVSIEQLKEECFSKVSALLDEQQFPISGPEKQQLLHDIMDEVFGFGPLGTLLRDPSVSDILVNGPFQIYVERSGLLELTDLSFADDDHLMRVIQRIGTTVGRRIDESTPMLDARLLDGSRVNAIIPPLAIDGPALSIRRFSGIPIDIKKLIEIESIAEEMAFFIEACVQCKMNVLISGGTGTGKTTILNALSRWIPQGERVVTIEDAAELKLQRDHVVRLETRPPNVEGEGTITQRDLLRNTLRMRPDRIIIGEVRGAEAIDMLQAMNTGHEGSMTTVHANSPRDAMRRLENMASLAGVNFPLKAIREQISSAINILVHLQRMTGGQRKVVSVAEITGMEMDTICLHDIFRFVQDGVDDEGKAKGHFEACGVCPQILNRLKEKGMKMPPDMFQHKIIGKSVKKKEAVKVR
ncbi:MAG: CpaF family protein [Sedimentisphaerales bacterium]|nr:CpaF family protein [Sedimentisphaerales bacterium]